MRKVHNDKTRDAGRRNDLRHNTEAQGIIAKLTVRSSLCSLWFFRLCFLRPASCVPS
jgi:hypothetical protein